MAHLNILALNLGIFLRNMTQGERPKWQLYKFEMKKSTLIELSFELQSARTKDGLF